MLGRRKNPRDAAPAGVPMTLPADLDRRLRRSLTQLDALEQRGVPELAPAISEIRTAATDLDRSGIWRAELDAALVSLEPDDVTDRLKSARARLAAAPAGPSRDGIAREVDALQRRYARVHRLWDQLEAWDAHVRSAVAEVEETVAALVEMRARRTSGDASIEGRIRHLRGELDALRQAHDELDDMQDHR